MSGELQCQLHDLSGMGTKVGPIVRAAAFPRRAIFALKKRMGRMRSMLHRRAESEHVVEPLRDGDMVRVRSREEIKATLDARNALKGCTYLDEMWEYCGTVQQVKKHVRRFLNEADYKVRKCRGIVLLENVMCQGTRSFGPCDRSCFYFWREEWLARAEGRT